MHRIDGILLGLKPIAWNFRKDDLTESVFPSKRLPVWNERSRLGSEIGPDQTGVGFHWIGFDVNLIFKMRFPGTDIVIGLLDTPARFIEQPAVIIASQPALLNKTIGQIGPAMRALPVDETERSMQVFVQNKVFPEKTDRFHEFSIEFRHRRDRHPIAPQEFTHRSAWTDTSEALIVFPGQHYFPPSS